MSVHIAYSAENNAETSLQVIDTRIADLSKEDLDNINRAIDEDNADAMRCLLDKGINPNVSMTLKKSTPLMRAVIKDSKKIAMLLLSRKDTDVNIRNVDGTTALMFLVGSSKDNRDMIDLLIGKGADINAQNNRGCTALMFAVNLNKKNTVAALLSHDEINVNMRNIHGWTALIAGAFNDNKDMIDHLMSKGADINIRNNRGGTALIMAASNNMKNAVTALLSYDNLNVNARDTAGHSALYFIIQHYHEQKNENEKHIYEEIIHRLLNRGYKDLRCRDIIIVN
jgi:ankyrin repeat protein